LQKVFRKHVAHHFQKNRDTPMKFTETGKQLSASVLLSTGLLLTACGGGDGGSTSSNGITSISGTAATGAAMTSGTVALSCKSGLTKTGIAISPTGIWSTTVPTVNLPCAVKASDGTNTYYSFTIGNGSSIVTNVTPLTTLALAQILGAVPSALFATLSATDLAKLNDTAINAAISALNTVLASYALPANFNPVTTLLTAATTSQPGNNYDGLLDQFNDALGATTLDSLITAAATGTIPTLPAPSYTAGTSSSSAFFTTFAGDYTLKVNSSGAEGSNNATVTSLFPLDSARTVHIKANGDVSIDAVGRTITYTASTYAGNTTSASPSPRTQFTGNTSTQNVIRYLSSNGNTNDLYITYDPSNGKLQIDPQGFVSNEGYASLRGNIVAPPAALPPASTPTPPVLTSFAPTSGAVGATVTLTGTGFSITPANNIVRFSSNTTGPAPQATVVSASRTQLVVTVPAGAVSGQLTVYNTEVEAVVTSADSFTVSSASGGGSQSGSISFSTSGTSTAAASISTLVGTYAGTIGRVFDTGIATVDTTACTITVAANGDITVASGSKTVTAGVNGDVGDVITGPLNANLYKVQASDTASDKYAEVTIVNGYVTAAVARNSGTGFTTATDRVECKINNPHATMAGTLTTANIVNGATAANIDSNYVGTFSNGSGCTLTVSNAGVLHLVVGAQDITTALGGDQGDTISVFPSIDATSLEARDFFAGGVETYIDFNREGTRFYASARRDQPRPFTDLVSYSQCDNLLRQ
jgi:hypothetical protein